MQFSDYFNESFLKNSPDIFSNEKKNISELLKDEMLIVCGDFYGIQKFIFEGLATKHAAKVLRAKSAFVQLFTQITAEHICKNICGLDKKYILSQNAGKFEILTPYSDDIINKLQEFQKTLDEYFIKNFYALSGMSVVYLKCHKDDFDISANYKTLRDKISKKIEISKFKKFNLTKLENQVLHYDEGITNANLCDICNTRKSTHSQMCDICDVFKTLGEKLVSDASSITSKELHISFCDIEIKLNDKIKSYVAKDGKKIKDFSELAKSDKSDDVKNPLNALAILKADVDGMGAFIKDDSKKVTQNFANFDLFSKNIDAFFSLYVPKIIKKDFVNTYVVFAGGDDLFILGEFKSALNLARKIRTEFKQFAKELSISFGIALAKPSKPISYLAQHTEHLLEDSKKIDKKDAITLFNESVKWDDYLKIYKDLKDKLSITALASDDKTAFFYRLIDFCKMSKRLQDTNEGFDPRYDAMWKSKLTYSFKRNLENFSDDLLQTLLDNIQKYPKESKMAIFELIYTRREKHEL